MDKSRKCQFILQQNHDFSRRIWYNKCMIYNQYVLERMKEMETCNLCPHHCGVNRSKGEKGVCQCGNQIEMALADLHFYEEPCISWKEGSGAIFFSHCNLRCVFCQNYEISAEGYGKKVTIEELADCMLNLQERGANNINLVTPTPYVHLIRKAIDKAKKEGLHIPIIYNSSGYETVETIEQLKGYIDIYLPDFKYADNVLAKKYSRATHYVEYATKAILAMYQQVGMPVLNQKKRMQKGLMIRHLVLPNHTDNSIQVLQWIAHHLGKNVFISLMGQYFPTYQAKQYPELARKITPEEYEKVKQEMKRLGFCHGYVQELEENEANYVPKFKEKVGKIS